MKQKLVSDIIDIVQSSINNYSHKEDLEKHFSNLNAQRIYSIRTERIALCIGIIMSLKFRDINKIQISGNYLKSDIQSYIIESPWNSLLLNYYNDLTDAEKNVYEKWYLELFQYKFKDISVSEIYETLLSYEWVFDKNGFHVKSDKSSRNRSGSYYTPNYLAELSIRKVLDQMIEEKLGIQHFSFNFQEYKDKFNDIFSLLTSLKVIDFSCGTGHFLKAVVAYFQNYVLPLKQEKLKTINSKELLNNFISRIWGVDIDFIALEIAKSELIALTGDLNLHKKINGQFIHGNPLLPPPLSMIDSEDKRKLTSAGFLYHLDLGLDWGNAENEIANGFDLVVGNPPWEKIRLEEKSFFRPWVPDISTLSKKDNRARKIEDLKQTSPLIYEYYKSFTSQITASKEVIKQSEVFKHSASGELNTYALFTELASSYLSKNGRVCYVIKSAIVVSPVNKGIFEYLLSKQMIIGCYDFINKKKIFDIDIRERFCVLILGQNISNKFSFKAGLTAPDELLLSNDMQITPEILNLLNPLTGMLPSVTDSKELAFLIKMHSLHPVLEQVFPECKFGRLVHFTTHSKFIEKEATDYNIPIFEGKFIDLYDGRYSTYNGLKPEEKYGNKSSSIIIPEIEKEDPSYQPISRYFIQKDKWESLTKNYKEQYSLMWRSLTSASNRRTTISTILPHIPASQSVQFLQTGSKKSLTILIAIFNSAIFDYMVRLKLNGIDLTQKILKQIAIPSLQRFEEEYVFENISATLYEHIAARVAILLENDERMASFADEIKPTLYPSSNLNYSTRKNIIAEIDYLISKTYSLDSETFHKILHSFPGFYSENEINQFFNVNKKTTPLHS